MEWQKYNGKARNSLSQKKKNSWNQLFSNFFSETITFTKFLRKNVREFSQFPHIAKLGNLNSVKLIRSQAAWWCKIWYHELFPNLLQVETDFEEVSTNGNHLNSRKKLSFRSNLDNATSGTPTSKRKLQVNEKFKAFRNFALNEPTIKETTTTENNYVWKLE